ncbi:MAG: acetate kinase [Bacteroidales bacterium]|nr:acetate kinase [Bacteroidales bacterium]
MMKILVLNCGSSSIKYQFIAMGETPDVLAKGLVERIGLPDAILNHQAKDGEKIKTILEIPTHQEGVNFVLEALTSPEHGVIKDLTEINAVGHRVAHGGEFFPNSVVVGEKEEKQIEELFQLAPLHNPANLKGIECIKAVLPSVPQVAVFDTSFHQTMPAHSYMYAIPYEYYDKYKVRRYGFHGTSHKFVAQKACDMLGLKLEDTKIISCHLGNGASICAIDKGKSIDTSMGLTPLEGLIMGTRCGDFEAGAVFFLQEKENLNIQQMNDVLNKKSGLQGISGVSSDMRDLETAANEGNERAKLALNMFSYRVKKYVGAYAAAMGGVDVILFTGGIGENGSAVREAVCKNMEYMGVKLDEKINAGLRSKDTVISTADSRVKVMLVTTDEELVIATDTYNLCK